MYRQWFTSAFLGYSSDSTSTLSVIMIAYFHIQIHGFLAIPVEAL